MAANSSSAAAPLRGGFSPEIVAIIVAAGTGSRFGSALPKQFCELQGRPVVMHAIEAFRNHLPEARLILVVSEPMVELWEELCRRHGFESPQICLGGATRWESVRNALAMVWSGDAPGENELVAVHDGARPLVGAEVIAAAVDAVSDPASGAPGAIPAVDVTDSLRRLRAPGAMEGSEAADRALYRAVQTPQVFRARVLADAYSRPWQPSFTDDASVVEAAGYGSPLLTPGSVTNIKITNPRDLAIAELLIQSTD